MRDVVAVDFDATLCRQEHGQWKGADVFGEPIPGAVQFTKDLAEFADVVVHTCRTNPEVARPYSPVLIATMVRQWLDEHGFVVHHVWTGVGKPDARAYVDNRAVECEPQVHGDGEFEMALGRVRDLCAMPRSAKGKPGIDAGGGEANG